MLLPLRKRVRITGTERVQVRDQLVKRYQKGASIRALAESVGRSYGFVHRLLSEVEDLELRGRGGANSPKQRR